MRGFTSCGSNTDSPTVSTKLKSNDPTKIAIKERLGNEMENISVESDPTCLACLRERSKTTLSLTMGVQVGGV